MFAFDFTIKFGDILTIFSFFGIVTMTYINIKTSLTNMTGQLNLHGLRLSNIEGQIANTTSLVTNMAVTSNRLDHIEQDIHDLRHGKGFVTEGSAGGINREYGG